MSGKATSTLTGRLAVLAALAGALAAVLWVLAAPAAEARAQQAGSGERTLYFELAIEGEPPAGTTFTGIVPGANLTDLTDPDSDGVYTGSLSADRDNYPRCIPVQIFGDTPDELSYPIRDEHRFCFGDGGTFSASYSFDGGGSGDLSGTGGGDYLEGTRRAPACARLPRLRAPSGPSSASWPSSP